jgi:hypothetical protein
MEKIRIPTIHTPITNKIVLDLLHKNHQEHHIFFKGGLHNHFPHILLSNYALGADDKRLGQEWENEAYLEPIVDVKPTQITSESYTQHIGQPEYYANYLHYFENEISNNGRVDTFHKYFFDEALFPSILSGAVHPLIHIGFGIEFENDEVLAEGFAMGCCQKPTVKNMLNFLNQDIPTDRKFSLVELFEEVRRDPEIEKYVYGSLSNKLTTTYTEPVLVDKISHYASLFDFGEENSDNIALKLREIYEGAMYAYGATVFHPFAMDDAHKVNIENVYKVIKPDFFLLHGLTSSLSLLQITPMLTNKQAKQLLRSHVAMLIYIYISRGRPTLHLNRLKEYPIPEEITSWDDIIRLSLTSTDVHMSKVIRSLILGEAFLSNKEMETGKINPSELPHNESTSLPYRIAAMSIDHKVIQNKDWEFEGAGYKENWNNLGFSQHLNGAD